LALYHLVAVEDRRVDIIDSKTYTPTRAVEQTYSKYAIQVRIYGKLFETLCSLETSWKHVAQCPD
jgi:hypothetical protein